MKIEILRQKIASYYYEITQHAKDAAADDGLDIEDIESIILTGRIERILTRDERGIRYIIAGFSTHKLHGKVVCRLLSNGKLRIITAYLHGE